VNEDLKLKSDRWWGAYVLIPTILLMQIPVVLRSIENISTGNTVGAIVGTVFFCTCLLLCLGLYAPSTFFFAFRIIGLVVFLAYIAYAIDCYHSGAFTSKKRSEVSLVNAIFGLFIWGIPGLLVFLKMNPFNSVYKFTLNRKTAHRVNIWFRSKMLEMDPEEDEETNLLICSEQLILWLKEKLKLLDYPMEVAIPEGWGWSVICTRDPYKLWIGCLNAEEWEDEDWEDVEFEENYTPLKIEEIVWRCYIDAKAPLLSKKHDVAIGIKKMASELKTILESEPLIQIEEDPAIKRRANEQ